MTDKEACELFCRHVLQNWFYWDKSRIDVFIKTLDSNFDGNGNTTIDIWPNDYISALFLSDSTADEFRKDLESRLNSYVKYYKFLDDMQSAFMNGGDYGEPEYDWNLAKSSVELVLFEYDLMMPDENFVTEYEIRMLSRFG